MINIIKNNTTKSIQSRAVKQINFTPTYLHYKISKIAFFLVLSLIFSFQQIFAQNVNNSTKNKTVGLGFGSATGKLSSDFNNLNPQNTSGIMFDIGIFSNNPNLRLAVDYFVGGVKVTTINEIIGELDNFTTVETLIINELDLGVRYFFNQLELPVNIYVGGGLASISADLASEVNRPEDEIFGVTANTSGSGSGTYYNLGARYVFTSGFTLGFDYRNSNVNFKISGDFIDISADGNTETITEDVKEDFGLTRSMLTLAYSF